MQNSLKIKLNWEALDSGSPEENASFAALEISAYDISLTEGHDQIAMCVRKAPYLSAYNLAEWLAWNWWRLRWEPKKQSHEWKLSHHMSSIGGGYIWPNIQIFSDGKNINFITKPTIERAGTPYRYMTDAASVISASNYEHEVDNFITKVIERLNFCGIKSSNLEKIWLDVIEERRDTSQSQFRKFEALLGEDPDELDYDQISSFISTTKNIGEAAGEEIAANRMPGERVPDIDGLLTEVGTKGDKTNPSDRVKLRTKIDTYSDSKAWRIGVDTARALRAQEGHACEPVSNKKLAELFGVQSKMLSTRMSSDTDISVSFLSSNTSGKVLLRSKWETGRRFELARLLGDYLMHDIDEPMSPATRTRTFRQKAQRAFAIEFLSPIQMVTSMLAGDFSPDKQEDVAHHFNVSPQALSTLLVNNNIIDREELDNFDTI